MASQGARSKEQRKRRLRFREENNFLQEEGVPDKLEEKKRRSITVSVLRDHQPKLQYQGPPAAEKWDFAAERVKCSARYQKVNVDGQGLAILKKLGGGAFSRVYEVFGKDKRLHVLKMVSLVGQIEKSLLKEVNLLTKLAIEPKIVRLEMHEVRLTRCGVTMLLLMEHGDCSITDVCLQPKNISISSLLFYWESILKCVLVLHSRNIIHLDIKPDNFILVQGHVKVTDLSSAELLPANSAHLLLKYQKGSTGLMGSECTNPYKDNMYRYSLKTDVFPLGVILHTLIWKTQGVATDNLGLFEFLQKVVKRSVGENQFLRPSVDQLLEDLGTLAVIPSPKKRKWPTQGKL